MKIQHARCFFFARLGPAFRLDPIFHFRWVIRKKRTPISAHGPLQSDQPPPRATGIKESPRLLPLSTFPSASHTHTSAFHPHNNHQQQLHPHLHKNHQQWLALSRPPESPLVARPLASSSLPRLLASPPPLPEVSRSLTATSPVPSLSVRFDATRSPLSFSSESFPSSVSSARLLRTSSLISDSSLPPSVLFRSPSSLTSSLSSRTPTCAPSTPSVLLSSPRIFSSPAASVVSATKRMAVGG